MTRPAAALLLAALAVLAHGQTLGFGFVMDDLSHIADNRRLGRFALSEIFGRGTWANLGIADAADNYRPLFLAWIDLQARLFGVSAPAFHGGNLLVHTVATLLVWRIAARFVAPGAAVVAAAVFCLHPAQIQPVSWATAVAELLMAAFALAAAWAHLRWRETGRTAWLGAVAAFYLAALLCKETAIALPLALLAIDRARRVPWRDSARLAVLGLAMVAWAALRRQALAGAGLEGGLAFGGDNVLRLLDGAAFSLQAAVLPLPQFFHFRPVTPLTSPALVPALAAWAGALWLAGPRRGAVAAVWFAAFVVPPLMLSFHPHGVWAFRFLYLPLAGAALLAGCAAERVSARWASPLLAVLAGLTVWSASDWRDNAAFYRFVIRGDPAGSAGYSGLSQHFERLGRLNDAEAALRQGLEATTGGERIRLMVDLGAHYGLRRDFRRSLEVYRAVAAQPEGRAVGLVGVGNNLWMMGDLRGALRAYEEALAVAPADPTARANRDRLRQLLGGR